MSFTEYECIRRYLHWADSAKRVPKGQDGYQALYSVAPIIAELKATFGKYVKRGNRVSAWAR